jgi:hypothetical protein
MPKKKGPVCELDDVLVGLDARPLTLTPAQCDRFGVGAYIGSGSNAAVYASAKDKKAVVKFTRDQSDAEAMDRLKGRGRVRPGLPIVHDVAELRGTGNYAIVMEKLDTAPQGGFAFQAAANGLVQAMDDLDPKPLVAAAKARKKMPREYRRDVESGISDSCVSRLRWEGEIRECRTIGKRLTDIVDALAQEGIASFDLHHENFGFSRRRPVVLDLGISNVDGAGPIALAKAPKRRKRRRR